MLKYFDLWQDIVAFVSQISRLQVPPELGAAETSCRKMDEVSCTRFALSSEIPSKYSGTFLQRLLIERHVLSRHVHYIGGRVI